MYYSKYMNTICLTMLVNNDINDIEKCLDSVKEFIHYWVICDTGSTDGTQDCIQMFFEKYSIPGELHNEEWVNFGHNRSSLLNKAKTKADYLFVIDADEIFYGEPLFFNKINQKDIYSLMIKYDNIVSKRAMIFNSKYNWKYNGIIYDYPLCDKHILDKGEIFNCYIKTNIQGSRLKDKYKNNISILKEAIKKDPTNSRYYFYLANSYFYLEDYRNAKFYYFRRIEMQGWDEEVYYSMYKYAICKDKLKVSNDFEEVLYDFLKAFNYRKTRLEALYEIVKYYRLNNKPNIGYAYGMLGYQASKTIPNDILYVNIDIYKYKFIDELSLCAWWSKNYLLSLKLTNRLLSVKLPKEYIERYKKNLSFCHRKIRDEYNIDANSLN